MSDPHLVVDASALVEYLLGSEQGQQIAPLITEPKRVLHVPALCDVEVAAALRRALRSNALSSSRAGEAVEDYIDLPLVKYGHETLIPRVLSLRENFTAYDATYVALAERVGAPLLTGDLRLASATSAHTDLTVLT